LLQSQWSLGEFLKDNGFFPDNRRQVMPGAFIFQDCPNLFFFATFENIGNFIAFMEMFGFKVAEKASVF
jgi:hypothetical protein